MHAYLIIAHNQFALLNKLLLALDYPENDIYIHIDRKADAPDFETITAGMRFSRVVFVRRRNVVWGDYSQIACEMELFEAAVNAREYEYIHLLSGVDFPLKSQKQIHDFFAANRGKEFVHFQGQQLDETEREKVDCYFPLQHFIGNQKKDTSFLYCVQRAVVRGQKRIGLKRHRRDDIMFYKGANWVSITGDFAKYLVSCKEEIRRLFRYSMCCDEIFLQTILMNSEFHDHLYYPQFNNDYRMCMRYIDWKRGTPYSFKREDYLELAESDRMFARKFDYEKEPAVVEALLAECRYTS
ncbi:MAG: beta-1,6-N-acetylglucosaminyltransferase [Acetatifactor sp.]|nr:beta-1,6-N-acetylglucosaminyltransferase [Acetatifactor sp.]